MTTSRHSLLFSGGGVALLIGSQKLSKQAATGADRDIHPVLHINRKELGSLKSADL